MIRCPVVRGMTLYLSAMIPELNICNTLQVTAMILFTVSSHTIISISQTAVMKQSKAEKI